MNTDKDRNTLAKTFSLFLFHFSLFLIPTILLADSDTNTPEPDIVVVADRQEQSVRDVPGSVQVVDGDAVSVVTAVNVADALSSAVGIDLQAGSFPNSASRINMRGMTDGWGTKRVLMMVDGRPTHDAFQGLSEVGLMPVAGIERIEVIRGPASTLYGSQAEAGAINIVTRKAGSVPETQVDIAGGSFGTLRGSVAQEGQVDSTDYRVLAGYDKTDGHIDNSDGTDRDWDDYYVQGNVGIAGTANSGGRLYFGDYEGKGTDENSDHDSSMQYLSLEGTRGTYGELSVDHVTGRLYGNFMDDTYDWKYGGQGIYDQQTLGASVQDSLEVCGVTLLTGVDVREDQVDVADNLTVFDEKDDVGALFVNGDAHVTDDTVLSLGSRVDEHDDFGTEWTPRAALLHQFGRAGEVFASVAKAYRTPSLSDRFVKVEYNGMLFQGNEDLEPETVVAYELGGRIRNHHEWSAEASLFLNDMKDSFDFMLDDDGVFRTHNATASESYGAEMAGRCRVTESVELFADYTRTEGTYTEYADPSVEGNDLVYLVHDRANAGVDVGMCGRATGTLTLAYAGERQGDVYNSPDARLDDYLLVNASITFNVVNQTRLTLSVDNIFDEAYSTFPGIPEPGTRYMAGISSKF